MDQSQNVKRAIKFNTSSVVSLVLRCAADACRADVTWSLKNPPVDRSRASKKLDTVSRACDEVCQGQHALCFSIYSFVSLALVKQQT